MNTEVHESTSGVYEKPVIIDFGSLERLTGDCFGANDGDAAFPAGNGFGKHFVINSHASCTTTD